MRSENQIVSYGAVEEGDGENGQVYNPTPSDSDLHGRQEKVKSIRHFLWNSLLYIAGSAMIALFLVAFRTSDSPATTSTISNVYSDRAPTGVLPPLKVAGVYGKAVSIAIVATNEYGQFAQKEYYPWMNEVPGTQLVEPYKETALTLVGSVLNSGATYNWKWTIENFNEDGSSWMKEGKFQTTQKLTFTKTGIFNITIEAQDTAGHVAHTYSTRLICKYVKRELRTLTEADRERFLDAAIKLWKINSNKGIQLYGSEYVSIDRLVAIHSLASNDIMCDGFHEGSGFLTHHLALTNSFEASLRAVDPAVTLPYWDFTIEGEAIQKAGKTPSYMKEISPAFTDEWFGSVDDNNHIVDSRWARTKMPKQTDPNGVRNSYGYIRSYWNNNNESGE
jgi:Common central domain of tyrosinase